MNKDPWGMVEQTGEDGSITIIRFRESVKIARERYPHLLVMTWNYEQVDGSGFPDEETYDQQACVEEEILDVLDSLDLGVQMLVLTGSGVKEWLIYIQDPQKWIEAFSLRMSHLPVFPIEMATYDEPGWESYQGFVENLEAAGSV